jgi:hypothetical protein
MAFLALTFVPLGGSILADLGATPLSTPVGRAAWALNQSFEH